MATIKQRDKMRSDGRRQFNIWLDADTSERMKRLSERTGKAYPALIADAVMALETALSVDTAPDTAPESAGLHDIVAELWERVERTEGKVDAVSRPSTDVEVLTSRIASVHSTITTDIIDVRTAIAELRCRVRTLETAKPVQNGDSGADMPEPLSEPSLEDNGAVAADSVAVVASESPADITVSESTPARSCETKADEAVLTDSDNATLETLIASIPREDFVARGNAKRNRRILELHLEGDCINQICIKLKDEKIDNSGYGSVENFLVNTAKVEPNRVNRPQKKK